MQGVSVTVGRVPIPFSGMGTYGGARYLYAREGQTRTPVRRRPDFGESLNVAASSATLALLRSCLDRFEAELSSASDECDGQKANPTPSYTFIPRDSATSCDRADGMSAIDADLSDRLAHPDQVTESGAIDFVKAIQPYADCTDLVAAATDSPAAAAIVASGMPKATTRAPPSPKPGLSVPWYVWAGAGALILVALVASNTAGRSA